MSCSLWSSQWQKELSFCHLWTPFLPALPSINNGRLVLSNSSQKCIHPSNDKEWCACLHSWLVSPFWESLMEKIKIVVSPSILNDDKWQFEDDLPLTRKHNRNESFWARRFKKMNLKDLNFLSHHDHSQWWEAFFIPGMAWAKTIALLFPSRQFEALKVLWCLLRGNWHLNSFVWTWTNLFWINSNCECSKL